MIPTALPKAVRQAICRNAHRLAMDRAYKALHAELQDLATNLVDQPDATVQSVVGELDRAMVDYVPRSQHEEA